MLPAQPSVVFIRLLTSVVADDPDRADALIDRRTCWQATSPTTRTFNELLAAYRKVGGIVAAEGNPVTFSVSCGSLPRRSGRGTRYLVRQYGTGSGREVGNLDALERVQRYDQLEAGDFLVAAVDYITCCSVVALNKSKLRSNH
jgi:hypothetical protein